MNRRSRAWFCVTSICCAVLLVPSGGWFVAASETPAGTAEETTARIPPEQLDSLVAPIALYPDPLLAQVLVASTYPLEIIQLQQWLERNPGIQGDALVDAVAKEPWDPSVKSMAAVPEALERLGNDIQWTTELGNAFLAQQGDVMDAVQRMRRKAQDKGALESNEQQKVETVVVEEKTVIVVESANPEVIYVPSYSPTVVYGPPVYPYPPVYYPPYPAGTALVAFGVGMMWGAALGGSCCGCGWGGNDVDINVNNNFNKNVNKNTNRERGGGSGKWQHDPKHRGGTPYSDRATANRYGGSARGDSMGSRQASASQQAGRQQGGSRGPAASTGSMNRSAGSAGGRASQPSASTRGTGSGASRGAGGEKIGSRSIPSSSSSRASAFGGGSSGFSGSSARSHSSRGSSSARSMGSRGGGSRGGGGRR